MKKITLFIALTAALISFKALAQTGGNTTAPAATLEVKAKNATGTSSNVDGILIPQVDRQRAQSMTGVPTSTLIYVNNISTGAATGTTVNVDAVGYYYFDGTLWVKLSLDTNIYTGNGTLTSNRTVIQGSNTLAFTGSAVNAFSVNGPNFSVDATNNRVGIGTASPGVKLDVAQAIGTSEATQLRILNTSPIAAGNTAYLGFNSYNGAGASWAAGSIQNTTSAVDNNFNLMYSSGGAYLKHLTIIPNGNVGIGTTTPNAQLQLGNAVTNRKIVLFDVTNDNNEFYGFGINVNALRYQTADLSSDHVFYAASGAGTSTELMRIKGNGNVGIGTSTPTNKLHINGTNPLRLEGLQSASATTGLLTVNSTGVVQKRDASSISAVRVTGNVTLANTSTNYFTDATAAPTKTFDNLNEFSGHTFTAAQTGLYQVSFTVRSYQLSGSPYELLVYLYAGNGPNAPQYGNFDVLYIPPIPGVGGSSLGISLTKSDLVKLTAGQLIQFQLLPYLAGPNTSVDYTIMINRVD